MESRTKRKRIIIIAIYLLLIFSVAFFFYWIFKSDPTCFDKKKNQDEEGIDCGGLCSPCKTEIKAQDLLAQDVRFLYGGPGKYDVLANVRNPNDKLGGRKFDYKFILKNLAGEVLAERSGSSFILQSETKNIIEANLETQGEPAAAEMEVKNVEWVDFWNYVGDEYENPHLNVYKKKYQALSSGIGFGEVRGLLKNESSFDYHIVYLSVVLRDFAGDPIAVNKMEIRDIGVKEERDFLLFWPNSFEGAVAEIEIEAKTNIYDAGNFTEKKLPGGKFQNYK